ncbi:MAG: alpha/beta hydrolase [Thermoanaerobaculales bacterium]
MRRCVLVAVVLAIGLVSMVCGSNVQTSRSPEVEGKVLSSAPASPDPDSRYLIYLHGAIIETQGVRPTHPRFGVYEYEEILSTFADQGFVVISEARPSGTEVAVYAEKVADQVRSLIDAGVPAENVTVVGFSKGGMIAILTSSVLADDRVNFVFIAACGPWIESMPELAPHGRLLAVREATDEMIGSCEGLLARAEGEGERRETVVEIGGGHGAFYRPRAEWVDPVVAWAKGS